MKCPICKKDFNKTETKYVPFCSERCKLIDLGNWASGEYKISRYVDEDELQALKEEKIVCYHNEAE